MERTDLGRRPALVVLVALASFGTAGCPTAPPPVVEDAGGGSDTFVAIDTRPSGLCIGDDDCDDGSFCNGRERCDALAEGADARGCAPARARACLASQICLEASDACETDCALDADADGDGVAAIGCAGGTDCDDGDPQRHPGRTEVCDGDDHDEDCDPTTFGARDIDRDGASDATCCNVATDGTRSCGDDCDDTRRGVRPLGAEVCNGLDDDCSGMVDEGVMVVAFADLDRDLHGDPGVTVMACAGARAVSAVDDDCDDTRRDAHGAQVEICDGLDNDCDGQVDEETRPVTWYADDDGDGFGAAASGTVVSCVPVASHSLLSTDCDDGNRAVSPVAEEACNGVDDDCSGAADFVLGVNDREDDDGDGHADVACGGDDCDDGDPFAYPDAAEICDHRDSDCDGISDRGEAPGLDETAEVDWLADADADGWGAGTAIRSCAPILTRVIRAGDCADADPSTHPDATDVCDGHDDDCDGRVDEDAADLAFYVDADGDGEGDGTPTYACRAPTGSTAQPGDCAPADPARGVTSFERCNSLDDDCDTAIDEDLFFDADGDGHGDPSRPVVGACVSGAAVIGSSDDCDDAAPSRSPGLGETCNGIDEDCDLHVDEGADASCSAGGVPGTCAAGRCDLGCTGTRDDCDGSVATGCETDLEVDPRNCGTCGTACGVAGTCRAGDCDRVVQVSMGRHRGCALRAGGTVMCWGGNGLGGIVTSLVPVAVPGVSNAIHVTAGGDSACAALRTGEVSCWGASPYGSAGYGQEGAGRFPPRIVPGVADAVEVAGTNNVSCARTSGGRVLCWGGAGAGSGVPNPSTLPIELPVTNAIRIEPSTHDTTSWGIFILTATGRVLMFGTGLVAGLTSGPDRLLDLGVSGVVDMTFGFDHSNYGISGCVRFGDGTSACTGPNTDAAWGTLGPATGAPFRPALTEWVTRPVVEMVSSDTNALCARLADGSVRCNGSCLGYGLRGDGCAGDFVLDVVNTYLSGVVNLADHDGRMCAVEDDGDLWCWGPGDTGLLGYGGTAVRSTPVRVVTD